MFRSMAILVMSFMMVFNTMAAGKTDYKIDIKNYIGAMYEGLPKDIKELEADKKINIDYKDGVITNINIKDNKMIVDSIRIGDTLSSVAEIYPKAWVVTNDTGVTILLGRGIHYGVATEYISYLSKDGESISEISLGYTADFTKELLPISNKEANELLQGQWKSAKGKDVAFNKGILSDSIFDKLYDNQEYKVIAPNEIIIYRYTNSNHEKVRLKFWVTKDKLYTFAVDKLGIPIKETIEKFDKVN